MRRTQKYFFGYLCRNSFTLQPVDKLLCFAGNPFIFSFSANTEFNPLVLRVQRCGGTGPVCNLSPLVPRRTFSFNSAAQSPVNGSRQVLSSAEEHGKESISFYNTHVSAIVKSVILRCSYIWEDKIESFENTSLQDLLALSHSLPGVTRRVWRLSSLRPVEVLEIFRAFDRLCSEAAAEKRDVEFCWKLFNWAENQGGDFCHLPESFEIMVSLLFRAGMFRKAGALLEKMEICGIKSHRVEGFDKAIEMYIQAGEVANAITVYVRARDRGLVLSESCYRSLLSFLIEANEAKFSYRVLMDIIEAGLSFFENHHFEHVIGSLCKDREVQEARRLLNKLVELGIHPTSAVLNEIAAGYCEKKDFEDLLYFLNEWKHAPNLRISNRIISTQCKNFGTEEAWAVLLQLEALGFQPDVGTFGVLISWSCKEGKLKNAFVYLKELLSRSLRPDVQSYNALIAEVFKEGMGRHAKDIFSDMAEMKVMPNEMTYKVLLAGYCKNREMDEAEMIAIEMVKYGLISSSPRKDLFCEIFNFLGLDYLKVKVKRDNDPGLPRAEFFDRLGNGLYLDADTEEFDKSLTGILNSAIVPNFDHMLRRACVHGNIENAIEVKKEMFIWCQDPSSSTYSALLNCFTSKNLYPDTAINLVDEMVKVRDRLDTESLNLLIQAASRREMIYKSRTTLDWMLQRGLQVHNETFSTLLLGCCKTSNGAGVQKYWEVAKAFKWLPMPKNSKPLLHWLCKLGMIKQALQLFESLVEKNPHLSADICTILVKELSFAGFSSVGHVLVEEALSRGLDLGNEALSHLLKGLCKARSFCQAFGMLDILIHKNIYPSVDIYQVLIPHLCTSGQFEKVVALKKILLKEQVDLSASADSAFIKGFCRSGKCKEAAHLLQEMIAKGKRPEEGTFDMLLQEFSREGNLVHARPLLAVMFRKNTTFSISTYRSLVSLFCKHGRVLDALRLKNFMLRECWFPRLVLYNILIFHLFRASESSYVARLLDDMHDMHLCLDEVTYNFLINGYYKVNNAPKALKMLYSMMDKNLKPSKRSLRQAIQHLSQHGKLEEALNLSTEMTIRRWPHGSVVQNTLAETLVSYGKLEEATLFLDQIESKGLIPNYVDYDILIKTLCNWGKVSKAIELLNLMLKHGNIPSERSYNMIVSGLSTNGAFDEALDFHAEMLHRNIKPSLKSCEKLVRTLCAFRRASQAEAFLGVMSESGRVPTSAMYQEVISQHCSENNLVKASELLCEMQRVGYEADLTIQWSLISNLSKHDDKNNRNNKGFLSRLLSQSGFPKMNQPAKGGY